MSALESALERQNVGSLQRVRSEGFPKIHRYGEFVYERYDVNRRNLRILRGRAIRFLKSGASPFEDQLGYDEFRSPDEVRHNIRPGGEVVFVRPIMIGQVPRNDIAVVTQELRNGILITGAKVVKREFRGKGIGKHLAWDAILRLNPEAATGRTRNHVVLGTYANLVFEEERIISAISPIETDGKYTEYAKRDLGIILEPEEKKTLDFKNGLYPPDTYPRITDLRGFRRPRSNPELAKIYDAMRDIGVDPKLGNALRYYAPINQDVLERARAAYHPIEVMFLPDTLSRRLMAAIFGMSIFATLLPPFKK